MRKTASSSSSSTKAKPATKRVKAQAAEQASPQSQASTSTGRACFTEGCTGIGDDNCDGYCVNCYQAMLEGRAPLSSKASSQRHAAVHASTQVQAQLSVDDMDDDFDVDGTLFHVIVSLFSLTPALEVLADEEPDFMVTAQEMQAQAALDAADEAPLLLTVDNTETGGEIEEDSEVRLRTTSYHTLLAYTSCLRLETMLSVA